MIAWKPAVGKRKKRNVMQGCTCLLHPSVGNESTHIDAEVFALADLPVPAWLIPPPLVRWALPLVFKKMVPLLAWLGKCEERTARGEESPFGDRVRDDVDGFYAAVRACLRGP